MTLHRARARFLARLAAADAAREAFSAELAPAIEAARAFIDATERLPHEYAHHWFAVELELAEVIVALANEGE